MRGLLPSRLKTALRRLGIPLPSRATGRVRPPELDAAAEVPFAADLAPGRRVRVAAICHIFYPDLTFEMLGYLERAGLDCDLLISTDTPDKAREIAAATSGRARGSVRVEVVPNRGRDVAPKFIAFRDHLADYDLLLFLQSKKSLYFTWGEAWRRSIFDALLGSPEVLGSILAAFEADPDLGIVLPQHFPPIRDRIQWGSNFKAARTLARRMGFDLKADALLDFPSGSMFWARPAALGPILSLGLRYDQFPPEAGQQDGTLAHALERLILFAAEHAGFGWLKVVHHSIEDEAARVSIASAADLDRFRRDHGCRLLDSHRS